MALTKSLPKGLSRLQYHEYTYISLTELVFFGGQMCFHQMLMRIDVIWHWLLFTAL